MQLWIVLVGCILLWGWLLVISALRIELSLRALGNPDGGWTLALAFGVGPFAFSVVAASGVVPRYTLHGFGRRYELRPPRAWTRYVRARRRKTPYPAPRPAPPVSSVSPSSIDWSRWSSLIGWIELVLQERKRLNVVALDADLVYGFSDIALTGRIAGALYALSGALPPRIRLTQRATWGGEERWELGCAGVVCVFPVLVLIEVLWYIVRRRLPRISGRENDRVRSGV